MKAKDLIALLETLDPDTELWKNYAIEDYWDVCEPIRPMLIQQKVGRSALPGYEGTYTRYNHKKPGRRKTITILDI
jgi:hypothetical protein